MFTSRLLNARVLFLMLAALSVVALAACGSDEGGDDPTATSSSNSATATATSSSNSNNPTPTTGSGLGDFYANACDAINLAAGIPGSVLGASASDSPQSETTRDLANYFESIIADALGDATPGCYLEVNNDDTYGIWVSYLLQNDPPSDAVDRMEEELVNSGVDANNIQTVSGSAGGQTFASVVVTGIDVLGEYSESDVVFYVSGRSVVLAADLREGASAEATATATSASGTPQPTATSTVAPTVGATGIAAQVDAVLRPTLEGTLGTGLGLTGEYSVTASGITSVVLNYSYEGTLSDPEAAFIAALEELGATVNSSFSGGGAASANFTGLSVDGRAGAGAIITDGETVTLSMSVE